MKAIVFLLGLVLIVSLVHAQTELPDPGITPDNPLYGLDTAFDQLSLLLTFDSEAKAQKGLEIARERLAEIRAMAIKNNIQAMEAADGEHKKMIQLVREESQKIKDSDALKEIEKKTNVEKAVEQQETQASEVKSEIKMKLSIAGIMPPAQQETVSTLLDNIDNRTTELKVSVVADKQKTEETLSKERGNAQVAENEVKIIEKRTGLTDLKKEKAQLAMQQARDEIASAVTKLKSIAGIDIDYVNNLPESPIIINRSVIKPPRVDWPVEIVNESETSKIIGSVQSTVPFDATAPQATRAAIATVSNVIKHDIENSTITTNITKDQLRPVVQLVKSSIVHIARAQEAYDQEKYGESWGQATAAYRLASNANKLLSRIIEKINDEGDDDNNDNNGDNNDSSQGNITDISFTLIESGSFSSLKSPQNLVVQNAEKFLYLWSNVTGHNTIAMPECTNTTDCPDYIVNGIPIDFTSSTVLASFMGQRNTGGYSVEIKKIVKHDSKYYVYIKYSGPGEMATQILTQPWTMVKTEKILTEKVLFVTAESGLPTNKTFTNQSVNPLPKTEVKIEIIRQGNVTFVYVVKGDNRLYFKLEESDMERIIQRIAERTGLDMETIRSNLVISQQGAIGTVTIQPKPNMQVSSMAVNTIKNEAENAIGAGQESG